MTHQDMIDETSDQIRDTKVSSKIVRWLNMAIDWYSGNYAFGQLHKQAVTPISTVSGTQSYALASDFAFMKVITIPSLIRRIYYESEDYLAEVYPDYQTQTGEIIRYYTEGKTIFLFRVPAGTAVLLPYSYQREGVHVTAGLATEYPDLPADWHPIIVQDAIVRGLKYSGNDESIRQEVTLQKMVKDAGKTVYRRLDRRDTFRSGSARGSRPPYVGFPSNYPRVW